jgi:translation elongation factor EF-1alpha
MWKKIGKVKHYYDKIGVAIIELSLPLSVGETVKFQRGGEDLFEQNVKSIQIEHDKLDAASRGDVIGLATDEKVKEGAEVFKKKD